MNPELLYGPLGNFPEVLVFVLVIWSLIWKGIALWRAARQDQRNWFIAILIISSAGILEIIYLAFFQKNKAKKKSS